MNRAFLGVLMVLLLSCVSNVAFAQDIAEKFGKAVDLFVDGKCDEALPMLREVHEETKSPNARLYIARCLQQKGQLPAAYNEMKATVADATERAATEPKYAETRNAAAGELAVLESKVGRLVVAVAEAPEGVAAEVDGEEIPIGEPWAVPNGMVTVVVTAPGKEEASREVEVVAGKTKTVALTLKDVGDVGPEPEPEPEPDDGAPFLTDVRIVGMAIAGVGVAGVVIFAITGSMAKSEFDELVDLCNDTTCPQTEAERVADGRTLTTIANVSAAVGGIALLVGTAMIIFGGADEATESETEEAVTLHPVVGPTYLGVHGSF